MKHIRKMLTLMLAAVMTMSLGVAVKADEGTHEITITNTDQNVSHTYEAYKVFSGNLDKDGQGTKLGNIDWGNGVDGAAILTALKVDVDPALTWTEDEPKVVAPAVGEDETDPDYVPAKTIAKGESLFRYCQTAQDVADILSGFSSTGKYNADGTVNADDGGINLSADQIDAFASIVADNLATKAADFVEDEVGGTYTATVTGDGYYFIKDTTQTLSDSDTTASDTLSKYLLAVVKDTTIVAKDTGLIPEKKIDNNGSKVAANSAAIGDTVNFEVTVAVPNTKKYEDHFWFVMKDTLPAGITFTGITSVKVDSTDVLDLAKQDPAVDVSDDYDGSTGYYSLKIGDAAPTLSEGKYSWEEETYDAVAAKGGQEVKLTFNEFKKFVEKNNLIGKTITIKYTGVVNDDAEYKATANENEVTFDYSNDPNYDYDGDNPEDDEKGPTGTTPESKTRTYTTSLKIIKVDEDGNKLADAIFKLEGTALNRTVLTGVKFEKDDYVASGLGETVDSTKYWKLKNGSYTKTDPSTLTNTSKYESTTQAYVKVTYSTVELAKKETALEVATNAQGIAEFVGLNAGTYTLTELAAPDGFNKITGSSTITISWEDPEAIDATTGEEDEKAAKAEKIAQGGFELTATNFASETDWNATEKQFQVTIENKSGTELPSTGGIGTTIFYVVGAILVIGAGVMLVTRRRMDAE